MQLNPFYIITIISVSLSVIMAIYFIFSSKGNKVSNVLFSILLLVFVCLLSHSFMVSAWAYMHFSSYAKLIYFLYLFGFLTGPLSLFYIKSIIITNYNVAPRILLHAIPYFVLVIVVIALFEVYGNRLYEIIPLMFVTALLLLIHSLIYTSLTIIWLKSRKEKYLKLFQKLKHASIYQWCQLLILFYIVLWFLGVNALFIPQFIIKPNWCSYTASIYLLFFFVFILIIVFAVLFKPEIFIFKTKYNNSNLTEKEKLEYYYRITSYIQEQKAYLNPDITLDTISRSLQISSRIISHIINESKNQHFNEYINALRIEESKLLLVDKSDCKKTILEILYQVGFNSKSVFNNSFKRHVGITPTEFRNNFNSKRVLIHESSRLIQN